MSAATLAGLARAVAAALLLVPALPACGSEPRPPREPAPEAPPPGAAPGQEPAPEPTPEQVPIAEDFAAEAAGAIDESNYRDELDALDRELSAESVPLVP